MTGIFYLAEHHDFAYIAQAPWPRHDELQLDWVDTMEELEVWLNQYVGAQGVEWAYSQQQDHDYWRSCIAFRQAKNKTLFLLQWS